ncbi:MAG: hypothetical protein V4553_14070 [Bacteroidota bacterium]
MKFYQYFLVSFLFLNVGFANVCKCQTAIIELQKSHINANVADKSNFDLFLKRDLEKYFNKLYGKTLVKWELLREGPTQGGVSYPKYYLWTKVYQINSDKLLNEGAVRVEAIDKLVFRVTDYLNKKKLKSNSQDMYSVFPALVCETIKTKL